MANATITRQRERTGKSLSKAALRDMKFAVWNICRNVVSRCEPRGNFVAKCSAFIACFEVDDYQFQTSTLIDIIESFMQLDGRERLRIMGGWPYFRFDPKDIADSRKRLREELEYLEFGHVIILDGNLESSCSVHCFEQRNTDEYPVKVIVKEGTEPAMAAAIMRRLAYELEANFHAIVAFPDHTQNIGPVPHIRPVESDPTPSRVGDNDAAGDLPQRIAAA